MVDLHDEIPEPVLEVCRTLESRGHRAWVVGGCIRDLLRGEPVSDWDLATSALPREVQRAFERTIPTGLQGDNASIKLYTIDGQLVRDLGAQTVWDGKNDNGNNVATGVYIFLVKTDAGMQRGRVAVIR